MVVGITRPDVETAWLRRRSFYRSEERIDDVIDIDKITHDPAVFVDFQCALFKSQSCEQGDYSGIGIGQ